jgi:peptidyl-prolyl cis-trans isomerase C
MAGKNQSTLWIIYLLFALTLLAGCSLAPQATPTITPIPPTATPIPTLTPTPLPLALTVNNEGIFLSDFEIELHIFQAAMLDTGEKLTPEEQNKQVIDDLVAQLLLAQAAQKTGYIVDDELYQSRLKDLATATGGQDALEKWQQQYGFTPDSFKRALIRSIAAAWQRDQILASVSKTADQVHARQILVLDEDTAKKILQQLESGVTFDLLSWRYDPQTGGDLGWFPKGYLTQPDVDKAAFELKPGQNSPIIHSSIGYHIIYIIERDPQHLLSVDAYHMLQHQALSDWLQNQRIQSKINIFIQ